MALQMKHTFLKESRFLTVNLKEAGPELQEGSCPRDLGCGQGPSRPRASPGVLGHHFPPRFVVLTTQRKRMC